MVTTRQHPQEFSPPVTSTFASKQAISTREHSPAPRGHWAHIPSKLVILWLLGSIPFVIWDTGYVLLRPYSMPGGALHAIWSPYALYGTVDYIYGWPAYHARNGFTSAQSSLNVLETICYLFYLWTVWAHGKAIGPRGKPKAPERGIRLLLFDRKYVDGRTGAFSLLVVFSASVMTLSKTILYGLNEAYSGFKSVGHNSLAALIFLWIIPNGFWIVFPSLATYFLGKEIVDALETASGVPGNTAKNAMRAKAS
ncbi:conserved hypothetical protein [Uncinocarpus reesii 1704]|uniref:EXPERA domain-containing protein n=1 Tax=Uncinocarpus reesii (strain UAMH 1704) TaxID=336963 RepID=C4JKB4_UNCRE|nr:uncharacterized protein UREG_02071 [Uncinocarpus reesii 1704]EEP77222.1 conserved hypothetical protein [Uncinocarpus reesii 1704]